jgi:arsenate reductase-like glutaredoxin family protein
MNKQRKTALKLELDGLRALKRSLRANPPSLEELEIALAKSKKSLEKIHDEEQDAFEKMSEKQQCSTAGEIAEECVALLEDAIDYMDELVMDVKDSEELDFSEIGYSMEDVIDLLSDILNM